MYLTRNDDTSRYTNQVKFQLKRTDQGCADVQEMRARELLRRMCDLNRPLVEINTSVNVIKTN